MQQPTSKAKLPLLPSIIFGLGVLIAFFVVRVVFGNEVLSKNFKFIYIFFITLHYISHLLINRSIVDLKGEFIRMYLTSVVIRLVLSLIFVVVFLVLRTESSVLFLANFFVLYLCFTAFEITNIYRNLRRFSERG